MSVELPPLPKPLLESVEHELWGQNVTSDVYDVHQMRAFARAYGETVKRVCAMVAANTAEFVDGDSRCNIYGENSAAAISALELRAAAEVGLTMEKP